MRQAGRGPCLPLFFGRDGFFPLVAGPSDEKQLLRELRGPTHTEDAHYLRILVGKLRHKLGDDAAAPRYILTEPGVGLRFQAGERAGAPPAAGAAR